ncbi:MAG: 3-oxoacyl-ACP reductase [Gammaproteobacteria bacterium]|nr:3-oxoacyl-ACP reductase [Gammaproteobacteria bacterium]
MSEVKVALVTGAASGIGRASAIALAAAGFTIAVNYRSKKAEAMTLLEELAGDGHQAFCADVADANDAGKLVSDVLEVYQRLDVLVNAAGQFTPQDIKNGNYREWQDAWQHSLQLNLMAPVNLAFLAAKPMKEQGSGKIINITSRGAFRGEPTAPAYGAAKSGLNSATQSLALALGEHGICVYAIAPGWTETPAASPRIRKQGWDDVAAQSPLGRIGRPSEIGNLVAFLAGSETDYLTGAIIDANGASYLRN